MHESIDRSIRCPKLLPSNPCRTSKALNPFDRLAGPSRMTGIHTNRWLTRDRREVLDHVRLPRADRGGLWCMCVDVCEQMEGERVQAQGRLRLQPSPESRSTDTSNPMCPIHNPRPDQSTIKSPHTLPGSPPRRVQYCPKGLAAMAAMPRMSASNARPPAIQASTSCCRVTWCRVTAISTQLFVLNCEVCVGSGL